MAATFLGTDAVQGLSAQSGMIIQNQETNFSVERRFVVDHTGEKVGLCLWGDEATTTLEALIPAASPFTTRMGVKVVLANTPTDFYRAAPASGFGDTVLVGARQRASNADFSTFSLEFIASPFMDSDA
jgi:hypothetical protein